jgi:hypothetical protein
VTSPPVQIWLTRLSAAIVLLMVVSSVAGLAVDGVYEDPDSVVAMLRAYDLVTLVVVVPLLVAASIAGRRGSTTGWLLWLSTLLFGVYNYAGYVFGATFNALFLVHVALFSLSVSALTLALARVDADAVGARFHPRTPARLIGSVLVVVGTALGAMWMFYSLRFAATGEPPRESLLVLPTANLRLGYVLDLALLVPGYAIAGVLLWRHGSWGYVLAGVLLPFSVLYQVSYLLALLSQSIHDIPGASAFDPGEPPILIAFTVATVLLYRGLTTPPPHAGGRSARRVAQPGSNPASSSSVRSRDRSRKRTPRGASSENPAPRPGTTSMVRCVWRQYSNWARDIQTGTASSGLSVGSAPIGTAPRWTSASPVRKSPSG